MNRVWPAAWLVAACFMLWPAVETLDPARLADVQWPQTPLDKVAPKQAAQWHFAREAWKVMPRGASYTVRSPDHHDTMSLYMITLGMFVDNEPHPSSYFGVPMKGGGDRAQVTLDLPCTNAQPDYKCSAIANGCVCRQDP